MYIMKKQESSCQFSVRLLACTFSSTTEPMWIKFWRDGSLDLEIL